MLANTRPFRYADLIALAVAAPIVLLSSGSAAGYGAGAATWLVIRALGLALDSSVITGLKEQIALRLGYRLARIVLLATATIVVGEAVDKNAGITALAVVASAFTIQLFGALIDRGGRPQQSADASF